MKNKAIILLSGGLDSVVSLAVCRKNYSDFLAITFNYGQKAFIAEEKSSKLISSFYNIEHKVINLDWLADVSTSSLTKDVCVPEICISDLSSLKETKNSSKSVWVPNRNGLFINIAACYAETLGYDSIIIGANKEEAGTFKDNSLDFIKAINLSLKNSTNSNISVVAPLINSSKKDIIKKAIEYNIPFEHIHSCYVSNDKHCGKCESCSRLIRALIQNKANDILEKIFDRKENENIIYR